jgi:DNA/RNA-binding domain of Phe-tRNA-synthetase-like protein
MSLQARTQGLSLTVEDTLRGALALGLLEAEGVVLGALPAAFEQDRDQLTARLTARFAGKPATDIPGVAEARALFHKLDVDPTKTRPSSEALLRRVLQGKGLPQVNAAVDVCNLCSLEDQVPLGLYDRDLVRGSVHVRVGVGGEGYPGIRKQRVNLTGRLLLADDDGPFGAPTSDSLRTAVTAKSRNLLVVLFCPLERADSDLTVALERIADRLTRYCSAVVAVVRVVR